jgi:hypothetical protein
MRAKKRALSLGLILVLSCVSCSDHSETARHLLVQTKPDAPTVEVLNLIFVDATKGDGKRVILDTFELEQLPPNTVLQLPPNTALENDPTFSWSETLRKRFQVYPSLDAVVSDRKSFNGPILVIRLDKLGLEMTESPSGNCRLVVTIVDSDVVPTDALGLNYLAQRRNGSLSVELGFID